MAKKNSDLLFQTGMQNGIFHILKEANLNGLIDTNHVGLRLSLCPGIHCLISNEDLLIDSQNRKILE